MVNKMAHPKKVMIWGAVGWNFKSKLVFIEGHINGDKYFDEIICGSGLLDDADIAFGDFQWLLQQDNAKLHIRKDVLEAMSNLSITILPRWPPYSPDLNIIETIWAIMKQRVQAQNPSTIEELKNIIQDVWDNLSFETINGLVNEMNNRLIKCIAVNGYTIQEL